MRGHPKELKLITITGKVFLSKVDDCSSRNKGDIMLCLNDEKELFPIIEKSYECKGFKGYFKAKVFDGNDWRFVDNNDFFEDRINQFTKSDYPLYVYEQCKARIEEFAEQKLKRTYREHYSLYVTN